MPITDLLERNSKLYGDEVALIEINPERLVNPENLKDSGKGILEGLGQFDPILFDKGQITP